MVHKKSWEEFKDNGLLWFTNTILHMFGWSIVVEVDEETKVITDAYPARVKFRGFSEKSNTKGYRNVSKYLQENIDELVKEANDEE
jgi:hypothetical protein